MSDQEQEVILHEGPVTILAGDHKDEPGIITHKTGYKAYEVLTLAGHTHVYRTDELSQGGI